MKRQYYPRDGMGQGKFYETHVMQMTGEDLHSKSGIAQELAHRDIVVTILKKAMLSQSPFVMGYAVTLVEGHDLHEKHVEEIESLVKEHSHD